MQGTCYKASRALVLASALELILAFELAVTNVEITEIVASCLLFWAQYNP